MSTGSLADRFPPNQLADLESILTRAGEAAKRAINAPACADIRGPLLDLELRRQQQKTNFVPRNEDEREAMRLWDEGQAMLRSYYEQQLESK